MNIVTKNLTRQHQELLALAASISILLNAPEPNVKEIAMLLNQLTGKLTIHLAAEDKSLYPELINSADATLQETAQRFQTEMGDLLANFQEYRQKYKTTLDISKNFSLFSTDTVNLFQALQERIDRENSELYPLLG